MSTSQLSNLGPLSDMDRHYKTGEAIVEIDVGRTFWFPRSKVELRTNPKTGYTDVYGRWEDKV